MRVVWLIFVGLLVAMLLVLPRLNRSAVLPLAAAPPTAAPAAGSPAAPPEARPASLAVRPTVPATDARADSIVAFGLAQQGTPYVYAGASPLTGFDCSGFIMYTFARFGVAVPHATALLINAGRPVARTQAQPADIVVFTGTDTTSSEPGHAGIVLSARGEVPLRFVHASSARRESGVKVSQVEGTDYERRFLQVRRVLGPDEATTPRPKTTTAARRAGSIAALSPRPVAVKPGPSPAAAPNVLPLRRKVRPAVPKKRTVKAAAKKAVAKKPVKKKAVKPGVKSKPAKKPAKKAAPVVRRKAVSKAPRATPAKPKARPASRKRAPH